MIQQLSELRKKEKILVESLREKIRKTDPDCKIAYLPNLIPKNKVKYVFIAMEPSLGGWAKDEEEAEKKVENGFRNFILTWDDFILHYCINNYLSPSYYVTDVSQAAMKTTCADRLREKIWPLWIGLLEEEINIVGQEDCEIIKIGSKVENFLKDNHLNDRIANRKVIQKRILHYSRSAIPHRSKKSDENPEEYENFIAQKTVSSETILDFARRFLFDNMIPKQISNWILEGLMKGELSESRIQLIFTYYKEFQEIKQGPAAHITDYRKFVKLLNELRGEKKISAERRRELDAQWRKNPNQRKWIIEHLQMLRKNLANE